jgi:predicted TIM-barrel fold metal-dependent hydrolase
MNRRRFVAELAATTVAIPLARAARDVASTGHEFIDTNVYLPDWVVRRSGVDDIGKLVSRLRRHGVTSAWVGSFEGVLHTDLAGVNHRLAETCTRNGGGLLQPFGTINPTFPDWEEDVRRCHEQHHMAGLRLFPGYHGYGLDDVRFARLVELATQRQLLVQIVMAIEDERAQNPALTAAPLPVAPLADVAEKYRDSRIMLLNAASRVLTTNNALTRRLTAAGVYFEIATLEGVAGIAALLRRIPGVKAAFGSHSPYFYFEAALLKLQESDLTSAEMSDLRFGHALAALAGRSKP